MLVLLICVDGQRDCLRAWYLVETKQVNFVIWERFQVEIFHDHISEFPLVFLIDIESILSFGQVLNGWGNVFEIVLFKK